jgi:hypothetical protein
MVFQNNLLAGASGVTGTAPFDTTLIGNSIWLDGSGTSGDSATDTWGSESNQDRWIWATWYQPLREIDATGDRNNIFASGTASNGFYLSHTSTASTFIVFCRDNAGNEGAINTSESYRDLTAWYHILVDFDSANAVANDRISLYVNGVRVGAYSGTAIGQNNHLNTNVSGQTARIGQDLSSTPNNHMQGYLAQTVFLDNKSIVNGDLAITDFLDTFTFGTNGSQRIPKSNTDIIALASAAGTNSFCLDYSDANNIVNDASTKGNNFSTSTIAAANQTIHTPSLSYPVFNALCPQFTDGGTWSEGNTKMVSTSESTSAITTLPPISTGKYYFQWVFTDNASSGNCNVGMSAISKWTGTQIDNAYTGETFFADHRNSAFYKGSTAVTGILGASGTYALCFDLDAGKAWVGLVDTSDGSIDWYNSSGGTTGDPANGTNPTATFTANTSMVPFTNMGKAAGTSWTVDWNFGQFGFGNSAVPTGFEQITSAKVAAPDYQGIDYFDATLYEGNGKGQRVGDFVPFTDVGTISQSVAFNAADEDELRIANSVSTSPSSTNAQKKTISCWLKPIEARENWIYVGNGGSDSSERIYSNSSGQLQYITRGSGSQVAFVQTTGAFLADPSQWVHVVFGLDYTDGSTEADRVKIWVNGVRITDLTSSGLTYPANNMTAQAYINKASTEQIIGCHPDFHAASDHANMYYAEYFMVDGEQLDASVFGQLDTSTNRWVPKASSTITTAINALTDGFGDCGFYLDFSNTSDYGEDDSGNNRDWTEGGVLDATNQFTDAPSLNFAVMNPGDQDSSTATTLSKGNLKVSMGTTAGDGIRGTLPYNGKMYWEVEIDAISSNSGSHIGIATRNHNLALTADDTSGNGQKNAFVGVSSFSSNLTGFISGSNFDSSYGGLGNNFGTAGKYLMFAVDTDAGKFWAGYDGTWFGSGNPAAGTNDSGKDISLYDTWFPAISRIGSAGSEAFIFNFGQTSFAHTPPTGFSKLNQDNLDNTASKLTAWAWIKNRDATDNHILVDRVRGVGKDLHSNDTSAEATNGNTVQRFLQRGVQIGSDVEVNTANESYVLWQWLLGDSATTGSSITTGSPSLTTTGIVADADHFSIVSYTGSGSNATVAHGLSAAPEMYWVRDRTDGNDWNVYADGANASPASGSLRLDSGAGFNSDGTIWNGVPTASLINLGTSDETNELNKNFIAYCFRSIPGVCKIGTYTGNGDGTGSDTVDGPYVSCGFRPRWILFKWVTGGSLSGEGWVAKDTARQTVNPNDDAELIPSGTNAEAAGATHGADILSNGFKIRGGGGAVNKSGATYLYMAMADIGGNGTLPPIYGR